MILSKDSNNNWTPTAGGTGTFIGTLAAFNAIKDTLPVNTVAYITDDGNGDLQPVDAVTNGDMHPVTSNAVYDALVTSHPIYTANRATITGNLSDQDLVTLNIPVAGKYIVLGQVGITLGYQSGQIISFSIATSENYNEACYQGITGPTHNNQGVSLTGIFEVPANTTLHFTVFTANATMQFDHIYLTAIRIG